ncbi:hypothetical protein FHW83_000622 [Duganella sp. SG902]|uniref:glycoside hydrolase family 19 protein n=1 Tax=Duganella sp. SG902 TaxID=2587016 RepID=UPI00159E5D9F|nr:glycoside hydrolase family 19 protein [Duganella sp. SG902]NVM74862.1 hypothetical protein [Duganella sp. SG902]
MRNLKALLALLPLFSINVEAQEVGHKINRDAFYAECSTSFPKYLFKGEPQKTFDGIFDYWESTRYEDKRWLAYILATAYRETAGKMLPVREGLCSTDQCSIDAVTALFKKSNRPASDNYAIPVNGKSYYGRGFVQLTHKINYGRVGHALGWGNELVENPDLALDNKKAIPILVEGAVQGLFSRDRRTGNRRKLSTYLNERDSDWVGARGIINPGSRRAHIPAKYAEQFYGCLSKQP